MEYIAKKSVPIKSKHVNAKTEVFLGDTPITDHCLSCDIRIEAGKASLDEIEIDVDGEITEKTRAENVGYLEFCQD